MGEDLLVLSPAQIEAAANLGRLARLAERLVDERSWSSLDLLFTHAGLAVIPMTELTTAARAIDRALERLPEAHSQRPTTVRELHAVRTRAATTIARRLRHEPLTAGERDMLALAAELYLKADEARDAARLFERAGNDARAADAYAALGDIDRMEACHARLDARRAARLEIHRIRRQIEADITAGQRLAALTRMQSLPARTMEQTGLWDTFAGLEQRLCRGRSLVLARRSDPGWVRRLTATPAVIGRDPQAEIPIRDPGVSRRHAVIVSDRGHLAIEDAASRAGTTVGGARLAARLALGGDTKLGLGQHCQMAFGLLAAGLAELRGLTGLDRGLHALVALENIDLGVVIAGCAGLAIALEGVVRLERMGAQTVRVAGQLIGHGCDLMHGDVIEIENGNDTIVLEVR